MAAPHLVPLTDYQQSQQLLFQLNPWLQGHGINNCPAAAGAVFTYLRSNGATRQPAVEGLQGYGFVTTPSVFPPAPSFQSIVQTVRQGASGNHVVVEGIRRANDPEFTENHIFNLVKIDSSVYWVDASVDPRTSICNDLGGMVRRNRFIRFGFTRGPYSAARVRIP